MILTKILKGKIFHKVKKRSPLTKYLFSFLLFLSFSAVLSGIQIYPTTLDNFENGDQAKEDISHDFLAMIPKASIGPTIENLTKTDLLELGDYANITVDINHTNGVDTAFIEIGGTNYTMTKGAGVNEYNYTWQPSAVGNIPFTIYANDSVGGEWSSLPEDSINVQDTTGPSLSFLTKVNGDPTELGVNVTIRITATDLSTVDRVWINFDGTNYSMNSLPADVYNYSAPHPVGTYGFTIYANDTEGNEATPVVNSISVEDTIIPDINNVVEVSGDPVEFGDSIYIRVNVTDLSTIDDVWIDLDGTNYTMNYISDDMYYYTASPAVGLHTYTIYANDTTGNEGSTGPYTITVSDTIAPTISNVVEVSGDPVEFNGAIYIRVNVTDLSGVDDVWIDLDGTNYTMIYISDDMYYYTTSPAIGLHTYTIYANDTEGNEGSTIAYTITVSDTIAPTISNVVEVSGDPVEFNGAIYIRVNVTDLSGVDDVWIDLDGTNYTMIYISDDMYYYTTSPAIGLHTYTIYANDTEGNEGSTIAYTITVSDTIAPTISNVVEVSGDPVEFNGAIYIRVNVTDLSGVDDVWIDLDGTNYTMIYISDDMYYYTTSPAIGLHTYTIYANDTEGNEGATLADTITVEDTIDPVLDVPVEVSGDPVEFNGAIYIRVNVTDLSTIDDVWIDLDGTNYTMIYISDDMYYYTTSPAVGLHTYTIYANDTEGNEGSTGPYTITVEDTIDPVLDVPVEVSGDPVEFNGAIYIRVNVTDLSTIDDVWIDLDGTNYTMNYISDDMYYYTASPAVGLHTYTIYANDTSGNEGSTGPYTITVSDTIAPTISNVEEVSGDPVEFNGAIYIRVNVTDISGVDDVWIDFDGTNYTMIYISDDMYYYTTSPAIGLHTYTIYANDTEGNEGSTIAYTITVSDTIAPTISNVVEVSGDPVEFNGAIYIRVNVTDLSGVDDVWIDLDGTNYTMIYISDDMYYYTASPAVGLHTYTIYANDTEGNEGATLADTITVEDTIDPVLDVPVEVSGDPVEFNGAIYIRVNVTDLSTIDDVWIDLDGTNYTMIYISDDMYYYTTSPAVGLHTYTIYANDTEGNEGSTGPYTITVEDTIDPVLDVPVEVSGDPVEFNGAIYIRVNVTDLSTIDDVWIDLDGTNYTMIYISDDMYYYTTSPAVGLHTYTIYANDTEGNEGSTGPYTITVEDTIDPVLDVPVEVSGDPVEFNGAIYIRVNVTDLSTIDDVWIDLDGTNYTMNYISDDMYYYTASPAVGLHTYTIYANDTSGNEGSTGPYTITVSDTIAPTISNVEEVSGDPTQSGSNVYIRVNVSDLSTIDDVWIDFDGTNYTMIYISDDMYYFSSLYVIGTYPYSIYANDTYGNQDSLTGFDIEVSDTTPPIISNIVEVSNDPTEFNSDIYIRVNVTHPVGVDDVWIEFNGINFTMTPLGGIMYYYTATYGINTYSYTIYSNSTIGIEGSSGPYTITVSDNTDPSLDIPVEVSGDPVEFNGAIYIRVNVTDLSTIDDVWIDLDGTNYTMIYISDDMYYYTASPAVGIYTYTIYANDTYENEGSTGPYTITIEDTIDPVLSNVVEVSGDPVEFNGAIYIRVNVTDLSTIDDVWIDLDGTNYTMIYISDDMYYYTTSPAVGLHTYTIYANDTEGNEGSTGPYTITVEDTIDPVLDVPVEVSGDPVEFNGAIYIRVNVTDLSTIDDVWIDLDGTNYTMIYISDDMYYYTTSPAVGLHTYTIYANDTEGNEGSTGPYTITVEDTIDPVLDVPVEVSGDPVEFNGAIYIRVNVTDLSTIDDVWIDLDGTNYTMIYISDDMYYYTTSPAVGLHTYTIYANDTEGNEGSTGPYTITVEDTIDPVLDVPVEVSGDPVEFNGAIYIRVNVTDLSTIDDVWIDLDGTNYTMIYISDDMYYYTTSPAVGLHTYTIYANDTEGNEGSTGPYTITVEDTIDPVLDVPVEVSGDPVEFNGAIYIRVNVTDLSTIDDVWIDLDGTNYTMIYISDDMYYYTTSPAVGLHTYTIYANDTEGNEGSTGPYTITVEDTIDPVLDVPVEVSGDPVEFNGAIYIRVNVTDLSTIDDVWIDLDGTNYTMIYISDDMYYYTTSPAVGLHTYTIYANDTEGNEGATLADTITVEDTIDPVLDVPVEVSGDPVEFNGAIYIRVNVTDLSTIDDVWIDLDGTNYTMNYISDDMYYYTASPAVGLHTYTIYANDTSGNEGSTGPYTITVSDTIAPTISNVEEVSGDPTQSGSNVYIRVNVSDLSTIDDVWIDFDGTNYTMIYISDDMYYFSSLYVIGTYPYSIYANDTYGNQDSLTGFDIEVSDTTPPIISNIVEVSNDPTEFNSDIYIRVNVTHPVGVDDVWIEFNGINFTMTPLGGIMYYYTATYGINTYSYTIYSNSTIGIEGSSGPYTITVSDNTDPSLDIPVEVSGDPVEFNGAIYIRVNVTDLSTIDDVWIDLDGTNYTMIYISDDMYYYTASPAVGLHTYTIYANDTEGNEGSTGPYTITVEDTIDPVLSNVVEVSGDPVEFNGAIYIRVNVTDLSTINDVWIDLDGTNYTMIYISDDMYYYTTSPAVAVHTYTIYANDTEGNEGSTGPYTITIEDTIGPILSNLVEVSGDPTQSGQDIYIRLNVSDFSTLDDVWIDFDGINYTMTPLSGDMYYYTDSYGFGVYSYTIYANDTYGNTASILGPDITVTDITAPIISNLVEVSGDPVEFNGSIYIRINVTDPSGVDSVWIDFDGTNYTMTSLSGDMYYYSTSPAVGTHNYTIYANDTYGNEGMISGDISVSEIVQSIIIFDLTDYATDSLAADSDFNVSLPIDNSSTMDWAKVYFIIVSGPSSAAPGDNWTPIDLVNGQATISSEYYDSGDTLSYYFEIRDTDGNIFYVFSSGISTSNATAQTAAFSFEITNATGGTPLPFDIMQYLPYILGGVGVLAVILVSVGIKKSASKRSISKKDLRNMKEAGDAAKELLERQKTIQKEASYAEKNKDYYTVVLLYEKLIEIADALFKFGRPEAADDIKTYKAKIIKYQEKVQEEPKTQGKPSNKQVAQQKAAEYLKMADDAENSNDFLQALAIHHQILILREEIKEKSLVSATKAKIKTIIAKIPNIKEISAGIVKEAENKYKEKDYMTAYANYRYLKTIFEALEDKTLIKTVDKLISDVSKYI
ncbi:hypothetical protein DSAG12_02882 [Promethearchaeum syntrophicum]|uniref:Uncharacterized protein n=1 Tax=Promethearchaeum syntrophicum TaxID=2594042 RepID=A0A5B9DE30_9ARCH